MTTIAPITQDLFTLPRKLPDGALNLIGLSRPRLRQALIDHGLPEKKAKMRTGQIWQWIYQKGVRSFDQMTNLSKDYRLELASHFVLEVPEVVTKQLSKDGTHKYLMRIAGGHEIETVYIPEVDRGTLCISSQVGCTLTCSFCHTGTQRLVRNLTAAEIIGQVMVARDDLDEWPATERTRNNESRLLSNIVLMGMGEPLYNFDNVRDAMKIAMDPEGICLSRRRITLSTSGVVPEIAKTAEEIGCLLAVSFHATTNEVRDQLVPINRKWNIEALLETLRAYPKLSNSERIT
ncbi:MAG: 23S rRNA (adenine(2503)-C(2))-methyltransferase RlmN, partial [Paracoccaceae bacterium]|nr:23S rRNA (adenine(2503)-C(2))-methyltransferase RlmN [Paracoccaceae bacterium]